LSSALGSVLSGDNADIVTLIDVNVKDTSHKAACRGGDTDQTVFSYSGIFVWILSVHQVA
jgi:hypothetical protein